ncbi:hypothetical protein LTR95_006975 [Oleoguttula sp. CCFEE 5521]
MPSSVASYYSESGGLPADSDLRQRESEAIRNAYLNTQHSRSSLNSPVHASRTSTQPFDESSGLLAHSDGLQGYRTVPGTPRGGLSRRASYASMRIRPLSRAHSYLRRSARAASITGGPGQEGDEQAGTASIVRDDRMWYDQMTSVDWVKDSIADAYRVKELRARKDWRGRLQASFDGAQGWILVAIIGCVTAGIAYIIDVTEAAIFDYKTGYCSRRWWYSKRKCCSGANVCEEWSRWSSLVTKDGADNLWLDFVAFFVWVVGLALLACLVTLQTKTVISSSVAIATLDENLGAGHYGKSEDHEDVLSPTRQAARVAQRPPLIYYPGAGSGVAEVKVILSGFVLHGYLGARTLFYKTIGLILSVGSGLSVGKEGPYVHVATCVGNIASRMFTKYSQNDGKRREVLSASAAAGVAVAFGAPISGLLFSLEEVSYYFPPKTLFRTFFCCIAAALSLRFLNPYDTGKIVLFEVRYVTHWRFFELTVFVLLGMMGGVTGALFIKASRFWATTFRRIPTIKKHPMVEVLIVAVITGLTSFWNRYTRLPVAELLYELAAPCDAFLNTGSGLCPTEERIPDTIRYLIAAFVLKAALTTVTFGIKVPAGIYVPSMVVGGLLGRIVGHTVQLLTLKYPHFGLFAGCPVDGSPESCVVPGVYALVAAGATMCGVTRLSVTLAVILFELTGSLEHVLPFSLAVLIAKWTADALEPLSIYDLLTDMNAYPFLDSKVRPVFTTELGDLAPAPHPNHFIDISRSPLVPAKQLRAKLDFLHMAGELDGGLPILRNGILVGLIPGPDLEFALDRLASDDDAQCFMSAQDRWQGPGRVSQRCDADSDLISLDGTADAGTAEADTQHPTTKDPTDFTPYIDPAPVSLDICSPMDLVFECFVKLGLRYICVLREGKFVGLVHKKAFVRYVKETHDMELKH